MTRRRRGIAVVAGVVIAAALVAAATLGLGGTGSDGATPRRTGPAATATITRQTLVESVTLLGEMGFGATEPLASTAPGVVTWLPDVGRVVRRGEPVLRADEQPVVLLYGTVPMYRALAAGAKGADVRQVEQNLVALGYTGFTVDDSFSAATTVAVKRWQRDLGLTGTGAVEAHRVVFARGPVRVAQRIARLGASATGDVIAVTGEVRVVTVAASPGESGWAAAGAEVTVGLPGGQTTPGKVSSVSAGGAGQHGTAAGAGQHGPAGAPDGSSGSDTAGSVEITVSIADQRLLDRLERDVRLDSAPVRVTYVVSRRDDVLTVPVAALLALAEGGYGLEAVGPDGPRVVAVEVGLFADGRVEVSGAGLSDGLVVGVPGA
jgi:peptidoglycan hydrolase-like protein with peptidoglycan-binding domain